MRGEQGGSGLIRRVVRRKRAQTPVPAALVDPDGNPIPFANRIDQVHSWCEPDGQPEESGRPDAEHEPR